MDAVWVLTLQRKNLVPGAATKRPLGLFFVTTRRVEIRDSINVMAGEYRVTNLE
jgi:hypothetical protein